MPKPNPVIDDVLPFTKPIRVQKLTPEEEVIRMVSEREPPEFVEFTMSLNRAEDTRLRELAAARGKSPEQCLKDFIAACQPGGSGMKYT
jgi:hypothetical protein